MLEYHRANRLFKLLIAAVVSIFAGFQNSIAQQDGTEIDEAKLRSTYKNTVVNISASYTLANGEVKCELGTGFLISNGGYVITAKHLILGPGGQKPIDEPVIVGIVGENFIPVPNRREDDCQQVGDIRPLVIVQEAGSQDAVLLKFLSDRTYDYVRVCRETIVADGERIMMLGFPRGQGLSARGGRVENSDGPAGMWQTNLSLNDGNSGGPVFNHTGRLIGIVAADTRDANDLSWVVPFQHFSSLFQTAQAPLLDCETSSGNVSEANCDPVISTHQIEWVQNDHSEFSSKTRGFRKTIVAGDSRAILDFQWVPQSVNNASGPVMTVNPDKRTLEIATKLTSGPMFDRWRGWLNGVIIIREVPVECLNER
ncbi:serine protease [Sinorhizobium meliloti]|uniref:S1 family peptidase n=1 Tax=Rhizobium meliloti TaxID=382 RepID=UPI000FDB3990|nr:serine protease [Sinorhizobium meliloti]RVN00445.1 serine protease [Sinorhizobium meliloti]